MRKIISIAILFAVTFTSYSQSLGYQDLGLLFSQDDNNGTARFTAMGGAFGALGGDISAMNINPAGISIFNNSIFSGTLNSRNSDINTSYYGNSLLTQNQFINFSQAGAVLVFDSAFSNDWSKFAMGFNYRITKDFEDSFLAQGNSGVATFTEFPLDNNNPALNYNIADEQRFTNDYRGELSELNVAFSSVHQNRLYLGLGLNFYDLNFSQQSNLTEFNRDANDNELDANFYQENFITGTGFSANFGFIYKAHPNFRFGLSYQTPTWYTEIIEDSNITNNDGFEGDTEIIVSNDNRIYDNTAGGFFPSQSFIYRLRTPSKITASGALIFGKFGLLSLDYSRKNFGGINLSGADFSVENQSIQDNFRSTNNFNVGTEWRFDRFSLRGGYRFEESPLNDALQTDNLQAYSIGGGYNFGSFKLDFAYSDNNRTAPYNFYAGFNVNPANLILDNRVFTATVSISL
ncbi:OmpP1/FadL family transporter [Polaribacter porphyrae]|uniref:Hemin receptor n=1 Tax=Polaribacter porphyrae TaxID=1137780 RepID=A0A2S7WSR9_9FLAO|nr:outer membrane protein transport protein [Polaribacter porphyrae]PQJ80506.1 hemin receptor [Polaribacter porphyrae]